MDKERITIGACWDGRDYYPVDYIHRLYNSVLRNTTHPFDFVLNIGPLAEKRRNEIDPRIRIIQTGLPYWWSGMQFWALSPDGVETDTLLYLDLDVVILGSLDDIIEFPSDQAYMRDGVKTNVSASLLRCGAGWRVFDEYVRAGMPQWDPLTPPSNRLLPLAAQSILDDPKYGRKYDFFPENWVCSYKLKVRKSGMPDDCRIVVFHGRPKPHECSEPWIKENWR